MHNKLSTFLWFERNAREAAELYCSIFPNSKITSSNAQTTSYELDGQRYTAFNGGPHFKLNAAVSIFIPCANQEQVDTLWDKFMSSGGTETQCGWLVDKYGLSWQICPTILLELMNDPDPVKAKRVVDAMLKMQKLDIATLQRAHAG